MTRTASPSADLRGALTALPRTALAADVRVLGNLQEKVCAVVDELKATGMSAEHTMLAIKGIAFDATLGPSGAKLVDQMVKWCLEHYFKNSPKH